MARTRALWLALLLGLCLALASCEPAAQNPQQNLREELQVALLVVEGGEAAGLDAEYRNAAELVRRDVSRRGGVTTLAGQTALRVEVITHGPSVEEGLRALRRALASGAVAIIGGATSSQALPMAALAEEYHTPFISPGATNPQLTTGRNFVFRTPYSDTFQAKALAHLCRDQGAVRAAVLYDQTNVYSSTLATEFARSFAAQGGHKPVLAGCQAAQQDATGFLRTLLRSRPQVLFLPMYHTDAPRLVRQARQLGFRGQLVGADGWGLLAGKDFGGMIGARFLAAWHPSGPQTKVSREFLERYTAAFGHQPSSVAALVYDAFGLVFQAAGQAEALEPLALAGALREIKEYEGVVGIARYAQGTPERDAQVLEITSRGILTAGTIRSADLAGTERGLRAETTTGEVAR
ncbi:MAG: ABC transporter substrate-binding protein [Proteobacteria bacterium]|nr:ABC transporter substrate-binding protein [Pseudomonadota bacterium]